MRISIDPNVRTAGNQTYSGFEDLFGEVDDINPGDHLLAMGLETDIVFDCKVTCIDYERRLIFLDIDWSSAREDYVHPTSRFVVTQ